MSKMAEMGKVQQVENPLDRSPTQLLSQEARAESEAALTYRRHLRMIEEERQEIRRRLDTLHSFEEPLLGNDELRSFVQSSAQKQSEALEKISAALGKIEERLRAEFPANISPMILAKAEEWHIKLGFEYPSPQDPSRMLRYGPGEKLPPNMTQKDCEALYRMGHIYMARKGEDGQHVFVPHPKVVQFTQAQIIEFFKKPTSFVMNFLQRNIIRLDTLLKMKVVLAEMTKQGQEGPHEAVSKLIDTKIKKFEAAATGQPGQPT
jgi:hypothetical protein